MDLPFINDAVVVRYQADSILPVLHIVVAD